MHSVKFPRCFLTGTLIGVRPGAGRKMAQSRLDRGRSRALPAAGTGFGVARQLPPSRSRRLHLDRLRRSRSGRTDSGRASQVSVTAPTDGVTEFRLYRAQGGHAVGSVERRCTRRRHRHRRCRTRRAIDLMTRRTITEATRADADRRGPSCEQLRRTGCRGVRRADDEGDFAGVNGHDMVAPCGKPLRPSGRRPRRPAAR